MADQSNYNEDLWAKCVHNSLQRVDTTFGPRDPAHGCICGSFTSQAIFEALDVMSSEWARLHRAMEREKKYNKDQYVNGSVGVVQDRAGASQGAGQNTSDSEQVRAAATTLQGMRQGLPR
ncbi:hypothetical protein EDC01DRAFT_626133 [Geopyxis carbonaria]|nr:hypothetical protein EDC01DRAFT_626133 [Geopyxis carbonaria]